MGASGPPFFPSLLSSLSCPPFAPPPFQCWGPPSGGLLMDSTPSLCFARLGLTSSPGCHNAPASVF